MQQISEVFISTSVSLPLVGLGTWRLRGNECTRVMRTALELGYRHIDTAEIYENHAAIRQAITGYDREKLFLTSKFTFDQLENESVEAACDRALRELGIEYLDLYLLHYPNRSYNMISAMHQALQLIDKHKVRAVGVSNFTTRHLQDLFDQHLTVSVNQVEFHPYLNQKELLTFCREHHVHVMSFRSLGKGNLTADPLLAKIGAKHHKTPSQICLRWLIEQGISVIPKASSLPHLAENLNIFDFTLDADDRAILDHLKPQHRFCTGSWTDFDYL